MRLAILILTAIVFLILFAISVFFMADAFRHMKLSQGIQKQATIICGGVDIVNCTARALQAVYESAQQLLVAVMELVMSVFFMILALYWILTTSKMLIELEG
jgi:hypothetical protein